MTDIVVEITETPTQVTVSEPDVIVVTDLPPAISAAASAAAAAADRVQTVLDASTATTQAGIATTQAGIATTQAGIATAQADIATAQADIATAQADIATAQAALADADRVLAEAAAAAAQDAQSAVSAAVAALAALSVTVINNIGAPGAQGFGTGICPTAPPAGMSAMSGYADLASANYGNYQYSDGSVMVWIPAFYYKWGTGANGVALNEVSIKPESFFADVATANAAGYALHRAFYDGAVQRGVFVDKYLTSNNSGTASSLANGIVLTSAQRGTLTTAKFNSLTGAPALNYSGALASAKTRGANFFCSSRFIFAALAMLSYAHARASTNTIYCAWYHATNNFPKGNNNNALSDAQDATVTWTYDGNGTYLGVGKTGSASTLAKSTHNGQASGVADLNGLIWEITPGLTSNGTNLYILKTSASMKAVTAGNTLATDLWGATGIASLYDDLGTTYGALWATGANRTPLFGSASQVLSEATSGNAWNYAGFGGPLAAGLGGTNAFGNDILYDYKPNEMCPISGGNWGYSSLAGVWTLALYNVRTVSNADVGFRAALYL